MENITNNVILKGIAGSELEVRKLPSNQKVAKASIIIIDNLQLQDLKDRMEIFIKRVVEYYRKKG